MKEGAVMRKKQTITVAIESENGIVKNVGKTTLRLPKTPFKGGAITWYQDKQKSESEGKNEKIHR